MVGEGTDLQIRHSQIFKPRARANQSLSNLKSTAEGGQSLLYIMDVSGRNTAVRNGVPRPENSDERRRFWRTRREPDFEKKKKGSAPWH